MLRLYRTLAIATLTFLTGVSGVASAQEVIVYYHTDAIGSVRMITDESGSVVANYHFLPFGEAFPVDPQAPADTRMFTGAERDPETSFDYLGARYYASGNGRFTTVDPGHVNGNIFDPQSWNGYAYARNNPLKYTDPTGTEYEICVYGASGYGGSCGSVSDQGFAILSRNPGAGIRLWGGAIFAGNKVVGYYNQTSVDPTLDSFIRQTGQLAAAELKYGTIGMGLAAGGGALSGLAAGVLSGGVGVGGMTTLAGEQGVGLLGNQAINQMIGAAQRELLREMFKTGRIPKGISERTLRLYKELAERAIAEGKDGLGVQARRLQIIAKALRVIK